MDKKDRRDDSPSAPEYISRRDFISRIFRAGSLFGIGVLSGILLPKTVSARDVWQIDPALCNQCGKCETECVLPQSAVKCVHTFKICGYCKLCGAYFKLETKSLTTGAENQRCPTGAVVRTYVEEPYYEYRIDEELCVGCGKCVKGCGDFGNGSLYLQIRQDRCLNCNECAIARACPSHAVKRISRDKGYLLKGVTA